jgi:hypothetical protein
VVVLPLCRCCAPVSERPCCSRLLQKSSREFQILATTLSLLDKGRYSGERIVDYLQIQEHRALLMTDQRVIFFDIRSHKSKAVVNYQGQATQALLEFEDAFQYRGLQGSALEPSASAKQTSFSNRHVAFSPQCHLHR